MKTRLISFFLALNAFFFSVGSGFSVSPEAKEKYIAAVESQSEYILSLAQPDGSVPMTLPALVDKSFSADVAPTADGVPASVYLTWKSSKVCPYFSCIALIGLMEAAPKKAQGVSERFINWYFNHLDTEGNDRTGVDGAICDYRVFVNPENPSDVICVPIMFLTGKPENDCDSTDSYAALFLRLLNVYRKTYSASELLSAHIEKIDRLLSAIKATYSPLCGLTRAKPGYDVCYLMDNCEVYEGLIHAAEIYSSFGESEKAAASSALAKRVKSGVKRMYSPAVGAFYSSVKPTGLPIGTVSMEKLYADGISQIYPIAFGIISPDSFCARLLYTRFNMYFGTEDEGKSWQTLDVGDDFPWAVILRAAVKMNDSQRTEKYFDSLNDRYFSTGCKYPYYCAEAGHVLSAAAEILAKAG